MQHVSASRRLRFIDDLRALAACLVMLFHFVASGVLYFVFLDHVTAPMSMAHPWHSFGVCVYQIARWGWLGVHIFFVLSGFVIALSIGDEPVTLGYVGRFIARRSLRLDPPYWVTIALTVLMLYVFNMFMRRHDTPIPHVGDVIANLTYTTGILNAKPVLPVLWTLCLEVQFYLLLVGIMFVDQRVGRRANKALGWIGSVLFWVITTVSVLFTGQWVCKSDGAWTVNLGPWQATYTHWWLPSLNGWFIDMWMLFALGAVLSWTMARRMNPAWLVIYCIALGYAAWPTFNPPVLTGLGTVGAILIAAATGRLHHGVGGRPVLLVGTVSYSLYLMHALVGPQVLGYGAAVVGHSLWADIPLVGFAYAVCIGVAWVMHKYVERPGIEVGKRFRHKRGAIPAVAIAEPPEVGSPIDDPGLARTESRA